MKFTKRKRAKSQPKSWKKASPIRQKRVRTKEERAFTQRHNKKNNLFQKSYQKKFILSLRS